MLSRCCQMHYFSVAALCLLGYETMSANSDQEVLQHHTDTMWSEGYNILFKRFYEYWNRFLKHGEYGDRVLRVCENWDSIEARCSTLLQRSSHCSHYNRKLQGIQGSNSYYTALWYDILSSKNRRCSTVLTYLGIVQNYAVFKLDESILYDAVFRSCCS